MKRIPFLPELLLLLMLITCTVLPVQAIFSAVTNVDKVNLLSEPTPAAAVIETLKLGDVVRVYSKSDDGKFWEVQHKNYHGWIMLNQISPKDHRY